jgi:hypothetical protein
VELDTAVHTGLGRAERLDLMERPERGEASFGGGRLRVPIRAHELVTVKLS